ncbi:hypothetical protein [Flammeovirga sp. SJP92]|uniref:hypothetical protein n=1 Tax=Flammeovirga sp. SJP92 TaxID=1775430 RepID=UPI0012F95363|nr:hypothetical protein [Flammeovirga sp. SJP92]
MKLIKSFLILTLLCTLLSCSEDEATPEAFPGVPSGEIAPVEERYEILTGAVESSARLSSSTSKWWKHEVSKVSFTCDQPDLDLSATNAYISFDTSGELMGRYGETGIPYKVATWKFSTDKTQVIIYSDMFDREVTFTFTELNNESVVYASKQSEAGCTATTWEKFVQ